MGDEWAAVCYFYASLHRVRAALLSDPIFSDQSRLTAKHYRLFPADAHVNKHMGYTKPQRGGPSRKFWGLNELVSLLYPVISAQYEGLYNSSLEVRYQQGLSTVSLAGVAGYANFVRVEFEEHRLIAA